MPLLQRHPPQQVVEPRLSLDGGSVLFATLTADDRVRLWVRDRSGDRTRPVPGLDPRHVLTSWQLSGDGRHVALATDEQLLAADRNRDLDASASTCSPVAAR